MDLTGRHLGKYELLERVGQGGMAYVYRAYQPTIDRHVAVKVLHSHLAEDATFLERFRREAKGLGSLRHPHIVSVIDFDVDDGWYYMVMDYIEGETLQAMLERRGRLPVEEALRLTEQLAGALDYAHQRNLVHRDIKPGNIMFADEAGQHPVITDFGLTRLLDNVSITLSGAIAGTPAYMSPEAAQGEKVDARGDIYSLGIVLYEMVTGKRPFSGETPLSVIMKLVLEPLPPALSLNPDLPAEVDAIISKATAKKPADRFQTAGELREALKEGDLGLGIGDWGLDANLEAIAPDGGGTQVLAATQVLGKEVDETKHAGVAREPAAAGRVRWLPVVSVVALLLIAVVVGYIVLNGRDGAGIAAATVTPTSEVVAALETPATVVVEAPPAVATEAEVAEPEPTQAATLTPAQPVGSLRFAAVDGNNMRPFTLALQNVPSPPSGFNYVLWFDIAGRVAPENVAALAVQDGRIDFAGSVAASLAASVSGVRLSLEPEFDDDPSISPQVAFEGTAEGTDGLAEILLFAGDPVD